MLLSNQLHENTPDTPLQTLIIFPIAQSQAPVSRAKVVEGLRRVMWCCTGYVALVSDNPQLVHQCDNEKEGKKESGRNFEEHGIQSEKHQQDESAHLRF